MNLRYIFFILICLSNGCREVFVPKPRAFLSLEYPKATYQKINSDMPFSFEKNKLATLEIIKNNYETKSFNLKYNLLNANLYLSYQPMKNNLSSYISEVEFRTKTHGKVANEVFEQKFENLETSVFGNLYKLSGPVASQSQFYITDKKNHFVSGSLYFETKANYDSILPAVIYIQKDITHFIESLRWKN